MRKDNVIDKNTEKWMEEQKEFFRREKEKLREGVPAKFEPKGPVRILQRRRYASTTISSQMPRRLRDSKFTQSQPYYWSTEYEGARYEKEFGPGYNPKDRKWPQGNGYGKRYGTGEKKKTEKSYKPSGTQNPAYYTTQGPRKNGRYLPANVLVMDKMGMGR